MSSSHASVSFCAARLRGLSLLIGLWVLGLVPSATAAPTLVVGFLEQGRPNARIRQAVQQFLERMGEEVRLASLSPTEQQCTASDCLQVLAARHRASRLLGGDLIPNDTSYKIQVWLFDQQTGQPAMAETLCPDCTPTQLQDMVARTAGQLVERGSTPLPPPVGSAPLAPVATTPKPPVPAACRRPYRTFGRGLALGAHGALAVAGLSTGVALLAQDGAVYLDRPDGQPDATYRLTRHAQLAFGLSALPVAGTLVAAIDWRDLFSPPRPGHSLAACPKETGRWTFSRGLAVGSLGALGLAGLTTSVALLAQDGQPYAYHNDDSPIAYDLAPHHRTAFGVTAALLAGLGLSLIIP